LNRRDRSGDPPRDRETLLVRAALGRVRNLSLSLPEDETVRRILKIRRDLDETIRDLYDPVKRARRLVRTGMLVSIVSAVLVVGIGVWRVVDRFSDPLGHIDEPVTFLLLFTVLFLLAWAPWLVAAVRARTLRRNGPARKEIDTRRPLLAFDVAVTKGLIQEADRETTKRRAP